MKAQQDYLKLIHNTILSRDTLVCGHCFEKETLAQLRTSEITGPADVMLQSSKDHCGRLRCIDLLGNYHG